MGSREHVEDGDFILMSWTVPSDINEKSENEESYLLESKREKIQFIGGDKISFNPLVLVTEEMREAIGKLIVRNIRRKRFRCSRCTQFINFFVTDV